MAKYINNSGESEVFLELLKIAEKDEYYNDTGSKPSDIIEQAHPKKDSKKDSKKDREDGELYVTDNKENANILDSYNNEGGLVENEIEQQEKDIAAALRMPDTTVHRKTIDYKKDASDKLANELFIISEEMRLRGQDDIAKFSSNVSDRIKKKVNLEKEAGLPLIPIAIGVGAVAVVGLVSAWVYSKYSSPSAPQNTGININIEKFISHAQQYMTLMPQEASDEAQSPTIDKISKLTEFVGGVKKSRDAFISNSTILANILKQVTQIDPKKQISAQDVAKNLQQTSGNQVVLSQKATDIVNQINSYNARYASYIKDMVIPELNNELAYWEQYFKATSKIKKDERGFWGKAYDLFAKDTSLVDEGVEMVLHLKDIIESLQADVQLRQLEAKHTIDSLSKKLEPDISKEFQLQQQAQQQNQDFSKNPNP